MNEKLEYITSGLDDITNPECTDRLLAYVEELEMEDEEFMELLREKLEDMTVTWSQPWYQRFPSAISRKDTIKIDPNQEPFRTDSFTKLENERIDKNWRKFVKTFNIPDKPICFARWRSKRKNRHAGSPYENVRQFVTAFLSRGLERHLYQVYQHIVSYYGAPVKGDYSETELKVMEICFRHCPNKAVVYLAKILGREPRGIAKRFATREAPPEKKRISWTLEKASTLLNHLIKHAGLPPKKLRNEQFPKEVWLKIQEEMSINYIHLRNFWYGYLHVQLFARADVKIKRLRRKILNRLSIYPYQVWTDIQWKEVLKHFPNGFTHRFLHRVIYSVVCQKKDYLKTPLEEVIAYGRKRITQQPSKRLRTLVLNEHGQLEPVRYQEKFVIH